MSDVTFTPEQIREIRRRIGLSRDEVHRVARETDAQRGARVGAALREGADMQADASIRAFPLKVTRYRTFTNNRTEYRVVDGFVEGCYDGQWARSAFGGKSGSRAADVAHSFALSENWTALAALADVAANPTDEEVTE